MQKLYRYWVNLFHEYRQFEVLVPYEYPNEGVAILTAQYGGKKNVTVQYNGEA